MSSRGGLAVHAVREAAHRLDRRGPELAPERGDEHFHGVRIAVETLRVDVLVELRLRHDFAAMVHQVGEDAKLVAGQSYRIAVEGDPCASRVEDHRPAAQFQGELAARSANQRPQPREHFLHPERLRDVVVRPAVDPLDLLVPAATRGQHEDGHRQSRVTPAPQDRETVDLRPAAIEHDSVVALSPGEEGERAPDAGEMDAGTSREPLKHMIGQVIRDLRPGSRMILRMPALAAVVVGSLGAGIGANTLVFSWIQAVVFNPIQGVRGASGFHLVEAKSDAGAYLGSSWPEYRDLRDRLRALDGLIAFRMIPLYVGEPRRVARSPGLLVSANYFSSLAPPPAPVPLSP